MLNWLPALWHCCRPVCCCCHALQLGAVIIMWRAAVKARAAMLVRAGHAASPFVLLPARVLLRLSSFAAGRHDASRHAVLCWTGLDRLPALGYCCRPVCCCDCGALQLGTVIMLMLISNQLHCLPGKNTTAASLKVEPWTCIWRCSDHRDAGEPPAAV